MATPATIGIYENGTLKSIYCHFDGYLSGVGRMLLQSYDTPEKVRDLINLGSISVLGSSTECPENHSFENQIKGYTVAYHRDRGEELKINCLKDVTRNDIIKFSDHNTYVYFADANIWFTYENSMWIALNVVIANRIKEYQDDLNEKFNLYTKAINSGTGFNSTYATIYREEYQNYAHKIHELMFGVLK